MIEIYIFANICLSLAAVIGVYEILDKLKRRK
jgi:hypothetical protein